MAKRYIGIDINSSHLHAVQAVRVGEKFRIERSFSSPLHRDSDSTPEMLRALITQHHFDRRAAIAVSAPHNHLFFRNTKADTFIDKTIPPDGQPDPETDFPIPSADIITVASPHRNLIKDTKSILVTALNRQSLPQRLDAFESARLRCECADAPVFALHTAIAVNHPELADSTAIILYCDQSHVILAITQDNEVIFVRNIPSFTDPESTTDFSDDTTCQTLLREIEITWRSTFSRKIPENTNVVLAGRIGQNADLIATLQNELNCNLTVLDLSSRVDWAGTSSVDPELCIAEGLALRALNPKHTAGTNFVKADNSTARLAANSKKQRLLSISLLAALAVVSLTQLFAHNNQLEKQYTLIKKEITEVFRHTLPDEHNIVDASAQMTTRLESLRNNYADLQPLAGTTTSPLDVLDALSTNTPAKLNIQINEIVIDNSFVTISAQAGTFGSVDQWLTILRDIPDFYSAEVLNSDRDSISQLVHFTVHITLTTEQ